MANSKSEGSESSKVSYKRSLSRKGSFSRFYFNSSEELTGRKTDPYVHLVNNHSIEFPFNQGIPFKLSPLSLIDRSRRGLDSSETDRIAGLLDVNDKEMARLLNQSVSTFRRHAKTGRLDAATSERLLMLGRLVSHGVMVFRDSGKFTRWLRRPLHLLADREPLDLMDSPTGVLLIEDILGRIEHGVFS